MRYKIGINGLAGLVMHAGSGIDPEAAINLEINKITAKKTSDRTVTENRRIRELEVVKSMWLHDGRPFVPVAAFRTAIETGARRFREGNYVREGLLVESTEFAWDTERYGDGSDMNALAKAAEFTVPVVVGRARILRTRALFEPPWSLSVVVDCDDDLIDDIKLRKWIETAGKRIGIGDWRPEKSGVHGRFELASLEAAS